MVSPVMELKLRKSTWEAFRFGIFRANPGAPRLLLSLFHKGNRLHRGTGANAAAPEEPTRGNGKQVLLWRRSVDKIGLISAAVATA
jgi:hypothetical protein